MYPKGTRSHTRTYGSARGANRAIPSPVPMPTDIGVIDLMIAPPFRDSRRDLRVPAGQPPRPANPRRVRVPGAVHVQERAAARARRRPGALPARADGQVRHRARHARRRRSRATQRRGLAARASRAPRPLLRQLRGRPEPGHGGGARARSARSRSSASRPRRAFPAGLNPQVPINDKKFYPIYAKCIELDIPICVCAGVPGPARAVRTAVRRAHRRGVLVLPRAEVRDAPRLRAVGRPRGEAAAEVAEPLLLDHRRSRRSTTRRTSSTSRTPAAPTR